MCSKRSPAFRSAVLLPRPIHPAGKPPSILWSYHMDPYQTFLDMFAAMKVGDRKRAREMAVALNNWFSNGGTHPNQFTSEAVNAYIASVLRRTARTQVLEPPFSLTCWYCDAGQGIASEEAAMDEGWIEIEPAPQLLQANFLGVCPACRGRHVAESNG